MSSYKYLDIFDKKQKAIDHCMWLNFKYRIAGITFGIINGPKNNFAVCEEATAAEMQMSFLDILPDNHFELSYRQLDIIRQDIELLPFWESIIGMVSVIDGEILRYIIEDKIPLDKIIRHELAGRGFDKNHRWCGFDKAREIWTNQN
ncbi:hypothetical protein [Olleya sp. UBA1516]|mgnify:CR=1 FL=1|uniref:hypothetical protein n=1 Tax=Olleya sp. UBA1516 TaxID=1947013 RepID=UPI0025E4C779|nr:hypothetical protein [Olleya sp. UBA1516]|tara:strand:- start:3768 stop:4208 length:441 start_codon:yes stop_codon:yes gene_type:complete